MPKTSANKSAARQAERYERVAHADADPVQELLEQKVHLSGLTSRLERSRRL